MEARLDMDPTVLSYYQSHIMIMMNGDILCCDDDDDDGILWCVAMMMSDMFGTCRLRLDSGLGLGLTWFDLFCSVLFCSVVESTGGSKLTSRMVLISSDQFSSFDQYQYQYQTNLEFVGSIHPYVLKKAKWCDVTWIELNWTEGMIFALIWFDVALILILQ